MRCVVRVCRQLILLSALTSDMHQSVFVWNVDEIKQLEYTHGGAQSTGMNSSDRAAVIAPYGRTRRSHKATVVRSQLTAAARDMSFSQSPRERFDVPSVACVHFTVSAERRSVEKLIKH